MPPTTPSGHYKLSPSALSTFLKSPKSFYWRYKANLEPLTATVATYDHDKIAGVLWSEFVDRFYKGVSEASNSLTTLTKWDEQTNGWVPEKAKQKLTYAFETLMPMYYQMFSPNDGCRTGVQSELFVENDRFQGYLDGLAEDGTIHEVKMTSRSPQLMGQLWKVQYSIQLKVYAVITKATGRVIEFAWKDSPHQIFRGPVEPISLAQLDHWEKELNGLADYIYSLGDDPDHYVCNPDSCCLVTKGVTSMCSYYSLCDMGLDEMTKIAYKPKGRR